jgi:hypothetical protein
VENLKAARGLMQNSKILLCNLEIDPKVTLEALKMAQSSNSKPTSLFCSPELKAQVSFSDNPLSVVRLMSGV